MTLRDLEKTVAGALLSLAGWQVTGSIPSGASGVLAVSPHTSNWDLLLGVLGTRALGLRPRFLVKSALMRFPLGLLMRPLGAVGVDRSRESGTVSRGVDMVNAGALLAVLPKGTRKSGSWRTGFYHIAQQTGTPVYLMAFDGPRRTITAFAPRHLTGDMDLDMAWFRNCLHGVRGLTPAVLERVRFEDRSAA